MVDPKPLLKTFGAGVDVVAQIATDKAVNARRQTSSNFDVRNGVLLEDVAIAASTTNEVPHNLGRVPKGAFILKQKDTSAVNVVSATLTTLVISASNSTTLSLWVV